MVTFIFNSILFLNFRKNGNTCPNHNELSNNKQIYRKWRDLQKDISTRTDTEEMSDTFETESFKSMISTESSLKSPTRNCALKKNCSKRETNRNSPRPFRNADWCGIIYNCGCVFHQICLDDWYILFLNFNKFFIRKDKHVFNCPNHGEFNMQTYKDEYFQWKDRQKYLFKSERPMSDTDSQGYIDFIFLTF